MAAWCSTPSPRLSVTSIRKKRPPSARRAWKKTRLPRRRERPNDAQDYYDRRRLRRPAAGRLRRQRRARSAGLDGPGQERNPRLRQADSRTENVHTVCLHGAREPRSFHAEQIAGRTGARRREQQRQAQAGHQPPPRAAGKLPARYPEHGGHDRKGRGQLRADSAGPPGLPGTRGPAHRPEFRHRRRRERWRGQYQGSGSGCRRRMGRAVGEAGIAGKKGVKEMIALKISRSRWMAQLAGALVALSMLPQSALAQDGAAPVAAQAQVQDNAIESISANAQGANVIINIAMRNAPKKMPIGFLISNPSRIALDFGATSNATGKTSQDLNVGDLRGVSVAQAGERTRLVLNLKRPLNYATAIDGKSIIVTIEGSGGVAQAVNAVGLPVKVAQAPVVGRQMLRDLDFKRGNNGEGRVVVDLPSSQVAVDVRQVGNKVLVDFMKTGVPPALRRRLDVTDFGTPVSVITTAPQGENTRMTIEARGAWEQTVYQSDTQLVIDVKPIKEDPNKVTQGGQGYRGEKLSFNFQNVEVRAALQAIADISGLNIITSDSVTGNLTLRLKEVPWDQALDVVLQAKGLDMRKNGTVLWIAPKEELLTKEKLELEQRAQIADLEPLRSEIFQLNYQKADAFRSVLGIDSGSDSKNRILSKRGSAIVDVRT